MGGSEAVWSSEAAAVPAPASTPRDTLDNLSLPSRMSIHRVVLSNRVLGIPAQQSQEQGHDEFVKLTAAVFTVNLPFSMVPVLDSPGTHAVDTEDHVASSEEVYRRIEGEAQHDELPQHPEFQLVCQDGTVVATMLDSDSQVSEAPAPRGSVAQFLQLELDRLLPLSEAKQPANTHDVQQPLQQSDPSLSPFVRLARALWAPNPQNDTQDPGKASSMRLHFALPLQLDAIPSAIRPEATSTTLYKARISPRSLAKQVVTGQCSVRFITVDEQRRVQPGRPAYTWKVISRGHDVPESIQGIRLPFFEAKAAQKLALLPKTATQVLDDSMTQPLVLAPASAREHRLLNRRLTCYRAFDAIHVASRMHSFWSHLIALAKDESRQSESDPSDELYSTFVELAQSVASTQGAEAALAAPPKTPKRSIISQLAQRLLSQQTGIYSLNPSTAESLFASPYAFGKNGGRATKLSEVDPTSTAFVSVAAMVKGTNYGLLADPAIKSVSEPIKDVHAAAMSTVTLFHMGRDLPSMLDIGLNDVLARQLVDSTMQPLQLIFPFSLAEIVQDQLPARIAHTVAEEVVKDITPRINTAVTQRLHRVMSRVIEERTLLDALKHINSGVGYDAAHILSISLSQTITPALLHTLMHNPQQDYFCYYCNKKQLYCIYCHANNAKAARQNYYAEFYAGFYSRYYTAYYARYFVDYENAVLDESVMRRQQVHYDQAEWAWTKTPRLVLEELPDIDPGRQPKQPAHQAGVATHGPGGTVGKA